MRAKSGFTLVEILIVVVILGILAAIVIPQFSDASQEAKTASLCSDLQTMRSQIALYKIQHNDELPGVGASFSDAMTGQTDIYGAAGTDYGPYLQRIPTNPFNNMDTIAEAGGATPASATDLTGWFFNTDTGDFRANDTFDANHWGL